MAYKIMTRYYADGDNIGESYIITSDNSEEDTNFEIGEKINIKSDINSEKDTPYNLDTHNCKACGYRTYGGFSYCPWCGVKYELKIFGEKKEEK